MDLEHERRLTDVESRSKSNTKRLDEIEKKQNDLGELVGTVKALAVREENVENDVKEIKIDVKSIKEKPGKRWDNLVSQIITLVVAALAGYFFAKFGL